MKETRLIGSIIAVLAILLIGCGAVSAADTIDFSNGEATISVGDISVTNGDTLNIKIDITNLDTVADGSKLKVTLDGFHDMLDGLTLSSFKMKMNAKGVDTANSNVNVGTFFINVDMGSIDSLKSMTITKETTKFGFNLLDMLNSNLYSVTLDILPTAKSASVSLDITAKLESTTKSTVNPEIIVKDVDVNKLTGNPKISMNVATSKSNLDKTYTLKVVDIPEETPTATPTATPTMTQTPSGEVSIPTQTPSEEVPIPTMMPTTTPTKKSPAPIFGILAGCAGAAGILIASRRNRR